MKITEGYLLKEIADCYVLIPVGQNVVDYKKMIHLNESGYFIVKKLQEEIGYEELLNALVTEYQAEEDEIAILKSDLDEFLNKLEEKGLLQK